MRPIPAPDARTRDVTSGAGAREEPAHPLPQGAESSVPAFAGGLDRAETVRREMLDRVPAMLAYWDRDLRNVLANAAYVEWFGKTPEEMVGMHIREVLGPSLFELNLPYMRRTLAGEEQLFDRTIIDAAGLERPHAGVVHPRHGRQRGARLLCARDRRHGPRQGRGRGGPKAPSAFARWSGASRVVSCSCSIARFASR